MGKIKSYRDLLVWQKAHEVTLLIISFVRKFPRDEIFREISGQLFSSASSVEINIAEGHSSYRGQEYRRFLEYSYRSAAETDNWLQIIKESSELNKMVDIAELDQIQAKNIETIKLLTNLQKSLKRTKPV